MSTRTDAVQLYVSALSDVGEATASALEPALADEVTSKSPIATVTGKAEVLAGLTDPSAPPLFKGASWSDPSEVDDTVVVTATMAPGGAIAGTTLTFAFDGDGRIAHVDQRLKMAPPRPAGPPTEVELTEEMADALAGAFANRRPVIVAYADADGQPHLSYRGSTQVFSGNQLAIWVRDPNGGIVRAMADNPRLALLYRDFTTRTHYQFHGRGWVDSDEDVRRKVYDASPEAEQQFDADRAGVVVIVDVDRVDGMSDGALFKMERGAGG